jgi:ubiquinone/menaquinone biosynthesis C-methylase UbiE
VYRPRMKRPTHVPSGYLLGYGNAERDRLLRQAMLVAPLTERLLRDAGIGPTQRVLDIGSGLGDVALIAARLVGPSGEVVGVERDAAFVERSRQRAAAERLNHVTFIQADANALQFEESFDAVVGRFALNHSPDPAALLRSLTRTVHSGGIVAFQEVAFGPALAVAASVPLWQEVLRAISETARRSGLRPDIGLALHGFFTARVFPRLICTSTCHSRPMRP